jgi:hypothetical protein
MILGSEPAFERVRVVLENDPTTSELLLRCRSHMRRAHDSCHFPAALMPMLKPDSGRLTDNDIADTLTDRIAEGAPRQLVEQNSETRLRDIGGVPKSLRRDTRAAAAHSNFHNLT